LVHQSDRLRCLWICEPQDAAVVRVGSDCEGDPSRYDRDAKALRSQRREIGRIAKLANDGPPYVGPQAGGVHLRAESRIWVTLQEPVAGQCTNRGLAGPTQRVVLPDDDNQRLERQDLVRESRRYLMGE
jgi:hypothetical protein